MRRVVLHPSVFVIEGFLTGEECAAEIARAEAVGFAAAPVTTLEGTVMMPDIRNNTRVMIDDPGRAAELWERARTALPGEWGGWRGVGLNERLRYYRYDPGQQFAAHTDGRFTRSATEHSRLTFMVYLNGGCAGGDTVFWLEADPNGPPDLRVTPETGKALVFEHLVLHEGAPLVAGRKYVLRTDVMFAAPAAR